VLIFLFKPLHICFAQTSLICIKVSKSVTRLISRAPSNYGERNKCVSGFLQGDCNGMLENDRRPIEMQMVAVDVISALVTCTCPRVRLFQIRSHPFPRMGVATYKQAASLQKFCYQNRNWHRHHHPVSLLLHLAKL